MKAPSTEDFPAEHPVFSLDELEEGRPGSVRYVPRNQPGGVFFRRRNLVLPKELAFAGEAS